MAQRKLVRYCLLLAIMLGISSDAWAFKKESRVPIHGCNGYFAAKGEAKFLEVRFEVKQKDREELLISVNNVPMSPGTTLVVYIDDEDVGRIVLDKKRCGVLKLSSESGKIVPRINLGTDIEIKTVEGKMVMQ